MTPKHKTYFVAKTDDQQDFQTPNQQRAAGNDVGSVSGTAGQLGQTYVSRGVAEERRALKKKGQW